MRTFHRSFGIRALSVGSTLLFALLWAYHLATGGGFLSPGGLVLVLLLLLAAGASLLNLGDRYRIDEAGIAYANPALSRLGLRIGRRVAWDEVVSVRAHRAVSHGSVEAVPSALFLELASGGRFVIDSVEGLEEIRRLISAQLEAVRSRPRTAQEG